MREKEVKRLGIERMDSTCGSGTSILSDCRGWGGGGGGRGG